MFTKPYGVTTHQNRLEMTILMSGNYIGFGEEIRILEFSKRTLSGALACVYRAAPDSERLGGELRAALILSLDFSKRIEFRFCSK